MLKKKNIVIIAIIVIPIIMFFVPVRFSVKSDNIDKDKEYYILKLVYGDVTDSGWYIVDGWNNQLIGTGIYLRYVSGYIPSDYISNSICYEYRNRYIVYGTLDKNTYTLNINSWDMMPDIHGGIHKNYLTIYDLNWFPWLSEKTENWRADSINE